MKQFIDIAIFSLACLLTPITIGGLLFAIVEICNKLQPNFNKLMKFN